MDQLDLQSALHILVNADMRLAAAVIERPGTQLIDIAVVMLQDTRMKQSSYKGKSPLPDFVIDAACAGNAEAVERVLQHYDGYINKLCTRTLYDGSGQPGKIAPLIPMRESLLAHLPPGSAQTECIRLPYDAPPLSCGRICQL